MTLLDRLGKPDILPIVSQYVTLQKAGKNLVGLCPFHSEKTSSFTVFPATQSFFCFGCQAGGDVIAFDMKYHNRIFLDSCVRLGIDPKVGTEKQQRVVATFQFTDGIKTYFKDRLEPGKNGRSKEFRFWSMDGAVRNFVRGCEPILYNQEKLRGLPVAVFVEGEAKADLVNSWKIPGIMTTCLDAGAGSPWNESYTEELKGIEELIICPDCDNPGEKYANVVATNASAIVPKVKVVRLPGLSSGEDIIDWEKRGGTKEKLCKLIEQAPVWTPSAEEAEQVEGGASGIRVVSIAELLSMEFPPRENILSPWMPEQGIAMAHAPRGVGKTHIGLEVGAAVTSGGKCLRWQAPKPRGVLYLDGEMPARTLQERLGRIVNSMDTEITAPFRILTPDLQKGGMPDLTTLAGQLAIEPHLDGISLVIVDNISTLCRTGRENEAEGWLPVQGWALSLRARGKSVLFIHHAGKSGAQRGTSRREDVLDTVINLRRPGDYRPDEGARFEIHFEKARGIYGDDVKPFEVKLITGENGKQEWSMKDLEESLTERVAALLNEGMPQNEIAEHIGVSKGTVSKHKQKAAAQGLVK